MEYFAQLVQSLLGEDSEQIRLVFVLSVAGGIALFALALMFLIVNITDPLRRRLRYVSGPKPVKHSSAQKFAEKLAPASAYILPKSEGERSKIQARLVHAGYRSPNALANFYSLKFILAIGLPISVLLVASYFPTFLSVNQVIFFAILASFIGVLAPNKVLDHKVNKRQKQLRNGFPDALDLLVVCTEAGLGLNAAIQRTAQELDASHPLLAEELALVNVEIRAGVDRMAALRNLASRTGLEDIKGLISLLTQSIRFGTSVADTLRVYAEEFRDKRMQKAEEQAAKIGTKLIFPLVFCLFPSFFLVAVGPAVLRLVWVFTNFF